MSWQRESSTYENSTAEFPVALCLLETVHAGSMPPAHLLSLRAMSLRDLQLLKILQDKTSSGPMGAHHKKMLENIAETSCSRSSLMR